MVWPLSAKTEISDEVEKAKIIRERMLHKVGNLTPLTKQLNPSVSNGPWDKKQEKILEHSASGTRRLFISGRTSC